MGGCSSCNAMLLTPVQNASNVIESDCADVSATERETSQEKETVQSESHQPRSGVSEVSPGREPRVMHESMVSRGAATGPSSNKPSLMGSPVAFGNFDFVVSNPPYVGFDEADKVQKSVRDFEPRVAVFAGDRGLDVIGPLIAQAHRSTETGRMAGDGDRLLHARCGGGFAFSHNVGGCACSYPICRESRE